jgi:hypothetical protein
MTPEDEGAQVIQGYRREAGKSVVNPIEKALRQERDEARGKLREIALTLGCPADEIIATLQLMEKQIQDAREIVRKGGK